MVGEAIAESGILYQLLKLIIGTVVLAGLTRIFLNYMEFRLLSNHRLVEKIRYYFNKFTFNRDGTTFAKIEYEHETRIILSIYGNRYYIKKPQYDSNPEKLFRYLYKNPNKSVSKETLVEDEKLSKSANLTNLVNKLGFTGELKQLFFKVSKYTALFRKRITYQQLNISKIEEKKLKEELKHLKLYTTN